MKKFPRRNGQTILVVLLFLMAISLTIVVGIANPVFRHAKNSKNFIVSRESYMLAEAGVEDALYRLKNNLTISATETITLNGETVETSITSSENSKTITSESNVNNAVRRIETTVETEEGVSFSYALQSGNGGFSISGGSTVNGNIYTNGNITGSGGATITGNATAANSSPLAADQVNSTPTTPTQNVVFGQNNTNQDFAQSFSVSEAGPLNKVRLYMRRTAGIPGNLTVRIATNSSGSPSNTTLDSATLAASAVTTTYGWVEVVFPSYIRLDEGEIYWLILDGGNSTSNYYMIGANTAYANGGGKIGRYGTSWVNTSPSGLDGYFELYTGGITSTISGNGTDYLKIGTAGGDAWAHTINSTNTYGSLYCQTGSTNNGKVCNTTRPDPSPQGFAISDANIEGWKEEIEAEMTGGTTYAGDLAIGWQGTTTDSLRLVTGNLTMGGGGIANFGALEVMGNVTVSGGAKFIGGPILIHGNLVLGNNGMTLEDNIWVKGDITVSSGAPVNLASSFGSSSGVIISDGKVSISGNGQFAGSGQAGSYPIILTTSTCAGSNCGGSNAISLTGGSGAVVLYAPYGTLNMSGGTAAKAMTAYKIQISGGGTINYDSGLVDISISSNPSGAWSISSWKEIE